MPSLKNMIRSTPSKAAHTRPPARLASIPVPGAPARETEPSDPTKPKKPVTIDLNIYERDKDAIRELSAYTAAEGRSANRSIIIRAALQTAKRDPAFLAAYDQIEQEDPRRKAQAR
jgi:hypothetical protein